MCEVVIFFVLAGCVSLLLWIVILDGQLDDYKTGVRKPHD